MPIHFLALLYPKSDKLARVEEILQSVCGYVHENEPGVLKYQCFRTGTTEKPQIVVWETYLDQAAVDTHKSSSKMSWLIEIAQKEDNMAEPINVLPLEQFAGWASRT